MALRLLQHKSLCLKADPDDALMCPWIAALPRQVLHGQSVLPYGILTSACSTSLRSIHTAVYT